MDSRELENLKAEIRGLRGKLAEIVDEGSAYLSQPIANNARVAVFKLQSIARSALDKKW